MKKIIIVLIILVGNFVNLYYMGQNAEKESEQDVWFFSLIITDTVPSLAS